MSVHSSLSRTSTSFRKIFANTVCFTVHPWSSQRYIRQTTWKSSINISCTASMTKSSRIGPSPTRKIQSSSPQVSTAWPWWKACALGWALMGRFSRRSSRGPQWCRTPSQRTSLRSSLMTGSKSWTSITSISSNSNNNSSSSRDPLAREWPRSSVMEWYRTWIMWRRRDIRRRNRRLRSSTKDYWGKSRDSRVLQVDSHSNQWCLNPLALTQITCKDPKGKEVVKQIKPKSSELISTKI